MDVQEQGYQFRGTLTEAQYRRIQWLSARKILLGSGLFLFAMLAMTVISGGAQVMAGEPVLSLVRLAPFVVLVLIVVFVPGWMARRQYRSNPALRGEVVGRVTQGGIEFRTEVGQARYRWDQIMKAKLAPDVALIYTSAQVALFLPRSFFESGVAWEDALSIIRAQVKQVKRA